MFSRLHQHLKDIGAGLYGLLYLPQGQGRISGVVLLELGHGSYLGLFLTLIRTYQFGLAGRCSAIPVLPEGVDADDGQIAVMFALLVIEAFVLDFTSLIERLHGAEDAAPLGDAVKLHIHRLLHLIGELLNNE